MLKRKNNDFNMLVVSAVQQISRFDASTMQKYGVNESYRQKININVNASFFTSIIVQENI